MFGEFSFCAFGARKLYGVDTEGGEYVCDSAVKRQTVSARFLEISVAKKLTNAPCHAQSNCEIACPQGFAYTDTQLEQPVFLPFVSFHPMGRDMMVGKVVCIDN